MRALKLDMTIPLGDAGHVHFAADIPDIGALTAGQRQVLAATGREFYDFAASTLDPATPGMTDPPVIHDRDASVLAGVTGSRIRRDL